MQLMEQLVKVAAVVGDQALHFLPFTFAALVITELMLRYGVFAKLEPLGTPLTRMSRLPPVSTLTFITRMGSVLAANSMLVTYRNDNMRYVIFSLLRPVVTTGEPLLPKWRTHCGKEWIQGGTENR